MDARKIEKRYDKERNEHVYSINGNEIAAIGTYNHGERNIKITAKFLDKEDLLYFANEMETDTQKQLNYILENDPLGVLGEVTTVEEETENLNELFEHLPTMTQHDVIKSIEARQRDIEYSNTLPDHLRFELLQPIKKILPVLRWIHHEKVSGGA
jgi:ferritin